MSGPTRREFLWAGGVAALAPWTVRRDPVRELRHLVRGPVLTPRNSRGLVFDARWRHRRPRAVVRAAGPRRRAGGACAGPRRTRTSALPRARAGTPTRARARPRAASCVDLRRLTRLAQRQTRRPSARAPSSIDMYAALARHGATVPAGSCPTVGLGGHWPRRRHGARRPALRADGDNVTRGGDRHGGRPPAPRRCDIRTRSSTGRAAAGAAATSASSRGSSCARTRLAARRCSRARGRSERERGARRLAALRPARRPAR